MKTKKNDSNQLRMGSKALPRNSEAMPKLINEEVGIGWLQLPFLQIAVTDEQETEDGFEVEGHVGEIIRVGDLLFIYTDNASLRYEVLRILEFYKDMEGGFYFRVLADKRDTCWRPNLKVTLYEGWKNNNSAY